MFIFWIGNGRKIYSNTLKNYLVNQKHYQYSNAKLNRSFHFHCMKTSRQKKNRTL